MNIIIKKDTLMLSIGLMSGTSCDGVDAALIETDGHTIQSFIAEYHIPYPLELQQMLAQHMRNEKGQEDWLELEDKITRYHVEAVNKLIAKVGGNKPEVIGFHGQTILHRPDIGTSWQIGNPHLLATLTGIDVVADFRRKDMTLGGQGAPLVPIFHKAISPQDKLPVAMINIGGVANVTYIGKNDELLGYDVGPGNALINDAMMRYYNKPYDDEGKVARSGTVDMDLIAKLMEDGFFAQLPPKSLDRNHFNSIVGLLDGKKPEDIVATLTMFTVKGIAAGLSPDLLDKMKLQAPGAVYLCGGGGKNKFMVESLQDAMPDIKVGHVEELGLNSDFMEAQAFAYLAVRCLKGLPSSFPETTGTSQATVCGVRFPS